MQTGEILHAVIADDLTGSCDTGCQFARFGLSTLVTGSLSRQAQDAAQILVLNSDSRKLSPALAQRQVYQVSRQLVDMGRSICFKKIDSTLKGNWTSELEAVVQASSPDLVLVAPAFPQWGRTTREGVQCIDGRPVSKTSLAHHKSRLSVNRGQWANIPSALEAYFGQKTRVISVATIRKGPKYLEREIESLWSKGSRVMVLDCLADEDMHNICLGGGRLERSILWVGSAGLARFLPFAWGCHIAPAVPLDPSKKPVLLINGSLHPVNSRQLESLCLQRRICQFILEDDDSLASEASQSKLATALQALRQGIDVVLSLRLHKPIHSLTQLQHLHATLRGFARKLIESDLMGGIILVGGETASRIYQEIEAAGIRVTGEIQPGIPYGYWEGGLLQNQSLVTKAGGFGHVDTLLCAVKTLRPEAPAQ